MFKEVSDLSSDTAVTLGGFNKKTRKDNPTSVEGYYLGSREVTNKLGTAQLHFFQTPKGNVGVWGKTDLNRKLGGVTVGTMVRASFDRMAPTPTGEMYKYKVEVDSDNINDNILPIGAGPNADGSGIYDDGGDADDTGGSNEDAEDFAQNQALAAAERKAKVEALLKKGKSKTP